MKVTLIEHTRQAKDILLFSKRTRYLNSIDDFEVVKAMTEKEKSEELDYVFNTISSSWEFIDYIFLIEDVTRAFTHQLVRHRVGTSFAQQTQRMADMNNFRYLIPEGLVDDQQVMDNGFIYSETMNKIKKGYNDLIENRAEPQDARGVLPTNILTNILLKINLRALSSMLELRLCVRTQGEFQDVAKKMRSSVVKIHPWASPVLQPYCIINGQCKFPRFDRCPIKKANPELEPLPNSKTQKIRNDFAKLGTYSPQPKPKK